MNRVSAKNSRTSVIPSSGNVFKDLQLPDAEEKQTKVRLAVTINQIIATANCSQAAASGALKVDRWKIPVLANYRLEGFSVECLMNFLNAVGRNVEIVIPKAPGKRSP